MSAFIAFRTAAVSILRPHAASKLTLPIFSALVKTTVRGIVRSHPKNKQIPFEIVQLQDADGTIHHPHKLSKILEDVDLDTHVVRLISQEPPIVRVFTLMEDKLRKLEAKTERKARETKRHILSKEITMSWFTTGQDLEFKINKIHDDLSKGDIRLEVVFNPKPNIDNPSPKDMRQLVNEVVKRTADVSVEWRERDFIRGSTKLFLQSTVKKDIRQLPTQQELEEMAKEEVKRQERQALRKKQKHKDKVVHAFEDA